MRRSAPRWWQAVAVVLLVLPPIACLANGCLAAQAIKLTLPLEELEARAQRDSNDAAAQYALALGYWSKKRYDDAERALRVAVTIEPRFAEGWLALGVLPFARRPQLREEQAKGKVPDDWKPALVESNRLMRRAYLIDPLVDLRILGVVEPPRVMVTRVGRNRLFFTTNPFSAFVEGHYNLAYSFFERQMHPATYSVPRDSLASGLIWLHGLCAAHLSMDSVAISDFQTLFDRALAREEGDSLVMAPLGTNDYRYLLGLMYQREKRWFDAIRLYRAALENDLGLYMAHVQLSRIYKARGVYDSAAVESRAAVFADPEDASLLLEHGIILTAAGQLPAAEDTLRHAMNANPRDSRAPYFLGLTMLLANKPVEARAAFERFLALAPSRLQEKIADARQRLAALQ
jgi:Tfp pilus assembly protein PilF